ncbi:MAG: hypothetical protein CM15mV124_600 [uncultured marine virus]|nr:MAG: hypothetical protein CM15mV124_600 [uncultured marine virus]
MSDQKYKIVDGEAIPVLPAKAKEIVKIKEQVKYMIAKLILILMLLIPILILLKMIFNKT